MKGKILDKIKEKDSTCYLVKIQLKEFVTSLPEGYKDYEVQREIVNNTYLDTLIDTVLEKKHIPPIAQVAVAVILTSLIIKSMGDFVVIVVMSGLRSNANFCR